jgi:hypothetical protein
VKATEDGRDVGRNGHPTKPNSVEEKLLVERVRDGMKNGKDKVSDKS